MGPLELGLLVNQIVQLPKCVNILNILAEYFCTQKLYPKEWKCNKDVNKSLILLLLSLSLCDGNKGSKFS